MIVEDLQSTPSFGTFKPRKLVYAFSPCVFILGIFYYIYHHQHVKHI